MSGFAAIIRFDGGNIEPGMIEAMTGKMAYRGPDGIRHWRQGPAALGHCMMHTTAESLDTVQPLANEDDSLLLVLDGWLHNYHDLRKDLLAKGVALRDRSDAELILRAYEVWGEDCAKHIDGEFAFLIWDRRRGEAFCTRDLAGLRPLHYHWDGKQLVVASDIAALLAGPGIEEKRNRGMIAEYLANEWINREETIWQGVMRGLPAHWMRFGKGGMQRGEYWIPPQEVSLIYKSDEEYFEHYREIFAESVRGASRTHLPLACDVSGGLDSSANFCMAHDLLRKGMLPAAEIKGYSYLVEGDDEANEIEYARAVARHVGAPLNEVPPFLPEPEWFEARFREDRDISAYGNGAMANAIGNRLVSDGCRVILNGEGGDEWQAGKRFYFTEQLADRDWKALWNSFTEDAADLGLGETTRNLLRFGVAPLLPRPLLDLRNRFRTKSGPNQFRSAFWLSPEMQEILIQRRIDADNSGAMRYKNLARRAMYMTLIFAFVGIVRDHLSRQSARIGYEIRSPMYSRKFIEFSCSTPERTRLRGNTRKFTHINALSGLLPEVVAKRKTKAGFAIGFVNVLGKLKGEKFEALVRNGGDSLEFEGAIKLFQHYSRWTPGTLDDRPVWELWGIFGIGCLCGLP